MSNTRIISFDYLRIISIFTVIMIHTVDESFLDLSQPTNWIISNFYESFIRWNVPIFFMISGALFLDQKKKNDVRKLYSKNILRILVAYFCWSLFYTITSFSDGEGDLSHIILTFLNGPFHFWFLRVLVGLYMITPIYRSVITNKKMVLYLLIPLFLIGFIVPFIISMIGFYSESLSFELNNILEDYSINRILKYSFYFVLGHYLFTYPPQKTLTKYIYILGCISPIIVFAITYYYSYKTGTPVGLFFDNMCPFTTFEAIAIYLFFISREYKTNKFDNLVFNLSKCSFGIYLIHVFIMTSVGKINIHPLSFHPLLFFPIYGFIVFVISFIVIYFLQKIKYVNKWII